MLQPGDLRGHLVPLDLAPFHGEHPGPLAIRQRQAEAPRADDLKAVVGEPQGVTAVLDVPAGFLDQLRPVGNVALGLPQHPLVLGTHVAAEALDSELRQKRRAKATEFVTKRGDNDQRLLRGKQRQHDGRISLDRQAEILPQRIEDQVGVAVTASHALGLGAPDVVLAVAFNPEDPLGRFEVDAHLVMVVGALNGDAVHAAADDRAQDLVGESHTALAVLHVGQLGHGVHGSQGTALADNPFSRSHRAR
ncbi:MAG: hypothetical protein M9891_01145 [Austwickia sp.]|nr:hypothetical protein [Austwickia sp.]